MCRYLGTLPGLILPYNATTLVSGSGLISYYAGVPVWYSPRPKKHEKILVSPDARDFIGYSRTAEFYKCARSYQVIVKHGVYEKAYEYAVEEPEPATPRLHAGAQEAVSAAARILEKPHAWDRILYSCNGSQGMLVASKGRTRVYVPLSGCWGGWEVVGAQTPPGVRIPQSLLALQDAIPVFYDGVGYVLNSIVEPAGEDVEVPDIGEYVSPVARAEGIGDNMSRKTRIVGAVGITHVIDIPPSRLRELARSPLEVYERGIKSGPITIVVD